MPRSSSRGRRLLPAAAAVLAAVAALAVVLVPRPSDGQPATLEPLGPSASGRPAAAAPASVDGPVTYPGFGYGVAVTSPTKDKPQSKLWFQDGAWWALMVTPAAEQVHVFELQDNHAWRDTGAVVDERQLSTADALWDGERLHIATRTRESEVRYVRLSYSPQTRSYEVEPGFPVVLDDAGANSVAIAKDSTGVLWATFVQDDRLLVTHSDGPDGRRWVAPFNPAGSAGLATEDDISSIDSFDGRIGVMWSNQRTGAFSFLSHEDGAPDDQWSPLETPVQGEAMSDGHVTLVAAEDGTLYAGVKTSLDDLEASPLTAPLVMVLERSPRGTWTPHVAGTVGDDMTRPELVLDEEQRLLHLFYATPSGGGRIFGKSSTLDGMRWAPGLGTAYMSTPGGALNNVTSTKQAIDSTSGLVLLASDAVAHRYAHAELRPASASSEPPALGDAGGDGVDALFLSGEALGASQSEVIAERLGWNGLVVRVPGAGLSQSRPGGGPPLVVRARELDVLPEVEVVVVQGGEVDAQGSPEQVEIATLHLIDYLRAKIPPSTGIVLAGPLPSDRPVSPELAEVNETLRAVARDRRVHFLDLVDRGLTVGDGDLGAELTEALGALPVGRR